jgi:hypothetical protein
MDQILPPTLIAAHPITRHIPPHIQSRLMDIGYAKEVLGAIVLTDDGLQRIAMGR